MSLASRVRASLVSAVAHAYCDLKKGVTPEEALDIVRPMPWNVERPKHDSRGDLATNAALVLAKPLGKSPLEVAKIICQQANPDYFSCEIAGPGFINLTLQPVAFHVELGNILHAGNGWGRKPSCTGQNINLEFVSANPTGPVTVASGRNAVIGDVLARVLETQGHRVTREYYVNDRGNQIGKFADSVKRVAYHSPLGEYQGQYVEELANWFTQEHPEFFHLSDQAQARTCINRMLRGIPGSKTLPGISPSLAALGIHFDVWTSETFLHESGVFADTMDRIEKSGRIEKKGEALFYKVPGLQEGERVFRKTDGEWTYFASDTAYCADKISRGYNRVILIVGADHHGYVPWVEDAFKALGFKGQFDVLLYQLVTILKDGVPIKMSKRAGNIITIDEVMDEIDEATGTKGMGADALRFSMLVRNPNSTVEFDVEHAKKFSLDNPVFYIQYAYARICGLQRKAAELGFKANLWNPTGLYLKGELSIIQRLGEFPEVVEKAAHLLEPHRIANYILDLSREFHAYYSETRGDPILPHEAKLVQPDWRSKWDTPRTEARLAWIEGVRLVYKSALDIMGVTAPERMVWNEED
jgi:arginyl-tRNA synthetase